MQNSKCNVSSLKKKKTEKPHKRYRIISLIFTKYPVRLFAKMAVDECHDKRE